MGLADPPYNLWDADIPERNMSQTAIHTKYS